MRDNKEIRSGADQVKGAPRVLLQKLTDALHHTEIKAGGMWGRGGRHGQVCAALRYLRSISRDTLQV